jgi:isocitrate/isopropylmalate dehydrogenase
MAKYKIGWLPGDGIGKEVMEAAKIVLDKLNFDAEYIYGDIGWEFWCKEGDAFPKRTIEMLKNVDFPISSACLGEFFYFGQKSVVIFSCFFHRFFSNFSSIPIGFAFFRNLH